jgi:hypothetical protein
MLQRLALLTAIASGSVIIAQDTPGAAGAAWRKAEEPSAGGYVIAAGTKVPLSLINSVSTKHSSEGDRIYLETVFPIVSNGRIVIPAGSYVAGTVTQIKRPGRVKGRGELYVRFDSLTLPNGVTRDFRARLGGLDGEANESLDREEGKVISEGNKAGDARTVAGASAAGTSVGVIAGSAASHPGMGAGIGAAAGATAGLIGVLSTRGPDAVLAKGSTIEMVLDRPLSFEETELNFGNYQPPHSSSNGPASESPKQSSTPIPNRRFPF